MPTIGTFLSSPLHSSHRGFGLDAGGENTASTVPSNSPSSSTTRTRPSASPVRSLKVCQRPAGGGGGGGAAAPAGSGARGAGLFAALVAHTPGARGEQGRPDAPLACRV